MCVATAHTCFHLEISNRIYSRTNAYTDITATNMNFVSRPNMNLIRHARCTWVNLVPVHVHKSLYHVEYQVLGNDKSQKRTQQTILAVRISGHCEKRACGRHNQCTTFEADVRVDQQTCCQNQGPPNKHIRSKSSVRMSEVSYHGDLV